ncbi:MAG: oligosaccharide flippase family protein, partial [Muribaculaceae bacterium]|nr:oligosaccharide flippase family protein [Muribaculaceae bacterium]
RALASASAGRVAIISYVVRRWSLWLGVVGALLTFLLAPLLSEWSFGNYEYASGFRLLSLAVLFQSLLSGEQAVMQGTNRLRLLAKSSLWGAVGGLAVSVPLYRFAGVTGVVPSILAYAVITAVAAWVMRVRFPEKVRLGLKQTFTDGREFMTLGLYMTAGAAIGAVLNYVFMSYITNTASADVLGYYQAGYTLVNRYVGLIFTAMVMEYYPRLSRTIASRLRTSVVLSHEISLIMWCLLPLTGVFIGCERWIVRLLYSGEFEVATSFMSLAMVGTAFRAVSWSMTYVMLAKGDGRWFLLTEIISGFIGLAMNIVGFDLGGMMGLGVAYLLTFVVDTLMIGAVCRQRYAILPARKVLALTSCVVLFGCACVLCDYAGWWYISAVSGILSIWPAYRTVFRR